MDQFGVLHDGRVAYPGAVDAVIQMHAQGLRIYILSNSSRQAQGALSKLSALGFPVECFADANPKQNVEGQGGFSHSIP